MKVKPLLLVRGLQVSPEELVRGLSVVFLDMTNGFVMHLCPLHYVAIAEVAGLRFCFCFRREEVDFGGVPMRLAQGNDGPSRMGFDLPKLLLQVRENVVSGVEHRICHLVQRQVFVALAAVDQVRGTDGALVLRCVPVEEDPRVVRPGDLLVLELEEKCGVGASVTVRVDLFLWVELDD